MGEVNEMISCIIPMYNTERYIERCIQSVLNQSYQNVEIIVVDDGSDDCSAELVKKQFPFDNVKLFKKQNGGVSSARNLGLQHAAGDYVFFLDADDFLPLDAFALLMAAVKEHAADVAIGRDLCFNEGQEVPADNYSGDATLWEGDTTLVNTLKDFPHTWNVCGKLFKKSFIEPLAFVEGKGFGEDSYFFFQCALKKPKTVYLEKNVYYVSLREGSATRSSVSAKKIEDIIFFINRKKQDIREQFAQYSAAMDNLEIKMHLVILQMLLRTDEQSHYEKQSLSIVRKKKKCYVYGQSNDRLYLAVVYHCYGLYKKLFRLLKR